ncbi:phosphotransferase [Devosia sp. Leaf64]|uniref:phosphotransferase enzyme family protein n=1 Tax=Devosia sp. Leaf64 TaxID=1736229 RepID=UPI000714194E|nr:phosphotransferase [Devosia sp. Leaf64]KQN78292.1 aminoglycoside phosphotransferase [Devosia sp. Leaf64]
MSWDALTLWDATRIKPLTGGSSNDVWSVDIGGTIAVARLGRRSADDLAWEVALLQHLDRAGLTVPVPIPTKDGRPFAHGLMVMTFIEGGPPADASDWRRVGETLRALHRLTANWPQRPGWKASLELLRANHGTRIDLTAMPDEAVKRCRAAWARLAGHEMCVVHGNPNNPANILMTGDRVGLVDWDEAHVDVPLLDLVLPFNGGALEGAEGDAAAQASAAWEAAVCWKDDYAENRLAEVRAVSASRD